MKGRIVVCKAYNQPFEIEEYDVPDPEPGAVVLRMTQAGVCGSDLHAWRGDMVNLPLPPKGRVMGHEGTGMVAMLGAGVTTDSLGKPLGEGDRVVYLRCLPMLPLPSVPAGRHQLVREPGISLLLASTPTSLAPMRTTSTCRHGTLYSRCRMSCPMSFLGHSIAPWEPLPKA